MDLDLSTVEQTVSTGTPPRWDRVEQLVRRARQRNRDVDAGRVTYYIPLRERVLLGRGA